MGMDMPFAASDVAELSEWLILTVFPALILAACLVQLVVAIYIGLEDITVANFLSDKNREAIVGALKNLVLATSLHEDLLTINNFDNERFPDALVFGVLLATPMCDTLVCFITQLTKCPWGSCVYELTSEVVQACLYVYFCGSAPDAMAAFSMIAAIQVGFVLAKWAVEVGWPCCRGDPLLTGGQRSDGVSEVAAAEFVLSECIHLFGAVFTFVPLLCPHGMFAADSFSDGCYTIALWSIAVLANAYMKVHFSKVLAAPATLFIVVFYFGHYLAYAKHMLLQPLTEVNVCTVVGTVHEYIFFALPQACLNFLVLAFGVATAGCPCEPHPIIIALLFCIWVVGYTFCWYKRFVLDVIPPTPPSLPPAISLSP